MRKKNLLPVTGPDLVRKYGPKYFMRRRFHMNFIGYTVKKKNLRKEKSLEI